SPQVTGVTLTLDALVALAEHPLVRSLKVEVPGSRGKVSAAHAAGIDIVAGWGGLGYVESVARGAIGCMPGCDLGPALLAIDHRLRAGDVSGAGAADRAVAPYPGAQRQAPHPRVAGTE